MTRKSPLRAVTADEKAPQKKVYASVTAAVADGGARDQLVALRAAIAKKIDDPNIRGADMAALSRRLLEIGKELDALDAQAAEEEQRRDRIDSADESFDSSAI